MAQSRGSSRLRRIARLLAVLVAILALGLVVAAWQIDRVVRWSLRPGRPFDARTAPAAPDYARPASWSALPTSRDLADDVPPGVTAIDQRTAPVDVFYVHPTSFLGSEWNATVPSPTIDDGTDRLSTRIQATVFNGCCAIYAPRYRQSNGNNFVEPSADGERAFELAYSDVARAFDEFNRRRGAERPFILAAHSQGSMIAEQLLIRRISRTPLRDKLVAAYLIGARMTVDGLRAHAPDIDVCASPTQLHCVLGYNARSSAFVSSPWEVRVVDPGTRVCVNPLSFRADESPVSARENLGAVFIETAQPQPRPRFADARCAGGTLRIDAIGPRERDFMSSLLDRVLGVGNYHSIEYQLFWSNLRANAIARTQAMLDH